ncbi:hypothetical protein QOZ80_5AG0384660 [Eleusine coracana subsp. coracana]|nr:hypothetical protein QOZ80_5AG0384660 [Eleusine coracana subsp. coracana]
MEHDIKALSSEKQTIKNEMDSLKTSGANMENETEDCSNKLKDTMDPSAILSLELEKATLVENKVQTLLAENLKLKNDNLMLLVEHDNLKERLEKLDMECFKLRKVISDTKAENEYLSQEKYTVERTVDQLSMDINCLNMEKKELESRLEQELEKISHMQKTNEALELANSSTRDEIIKIQGEKNEALASIIDLNSKLKQQANHISNLQETIKDLEAAKSDLYNESMVYQEEKTEALAQLQLVEGYVKNLESQLEQQLAKISHMEKTHKAFIVEHESKLAQQGTHISNLQYTNRDLEAARTNLYNKVVEHQEERTTTLAHLHQAEASMKNLESQLEIQLEKISLMERTHEALIADLGSKMEQQATQISNLQKINRDLEQAKIELYNKFKVHQEEKTIAIAQFQQIEASMKNLENKSEQQAKHISNLQEANRNLEATKTDLNNKVTEQQEEKHAALAQLKQVEASMKNLEGQLEQQLNKIVHMEETYGAYISDLESKLEQQAKHISNLEEINKNLEATNSDLNNRVMVQQEEKSIALSQLQEVEASMKNLEGQLKQQLKKTSDTEQTYGAFIRDLESKLEKQVKHLSNVEEINKELEDTKNCLYNELIVQQEEKIAALAKLQHVETSVKNLDGQLDQQLKKTSQMEQTYYAFISDLESKLEQRAKHVSNFQETNRNLEAIKSDLNNRVLIQQEEKSAALAKLQQVEALLKDLEGQLEQQLKKTSHMEQTYGAFISDLESKLEQQAKHISNLQETNKELEDTKGRLYNEVTVQQEEKTALLAKLQQVEASMKNLEGQLDQQLKKTSQMEQTYGAFISDLESKLEQQAKHISNHQETNRNLEATKNDLNNRVIVQQEEKSAALAKLQQVEASMKNLEAQLQQQLQKTSQIEQTYGAFISDLEGKLEQKGKYISSLQDTNRELEARMIDLNHHIRVQQEEKIAALAKLHQLEASLKDLEGQLEQQLNKASHEEHTYGAFISDLESKLEQQAKHISNLQETNKELEYTKGRLYNEVTVQQEENTALLAKLQQVEASLKNLEGQLDQQLKKTSQMEQTYGAFISDLEIFKIPIEHWKQRRLI